MNKLRTISRYCLVCGLMWCAACAAEGKEQLVGDTPCEKWLSLSRILSCDVPTDFGANCNYGGDECADLGNAWVECAARDHDQCYCESGDKNKLNCEGSYKPDEGPASCVAEYRAFDDCSKL